MERAVIEIFDALRPDVDSHFVQSNMIYKARLPVIEEMCRRGLSISLLPDKIHWPKIGRPRSLRTLCEMLKAVLLGNLAVLRASGNKDVLYVPGISYGYFAFFTALWFRIRGRRVIHHFHDLGTNTRGFPLWVGLVTDFVHNTEFGYTVVSGTLRGIRHKRNVVIPYILDIKRCGLKEQDNESCLSGKRNLFYVGQISRHKGVDILLQAFTAIAERHSDAMLHLVGGCAEDFMHELEEACSFPSLAGRVKYWGYREDVLRLLRSAYLYVQSSPPSRFHESYGRSVVEAMALGIPTVCFRSGALQEVVVHEQTGAVCEEAPSSLASAINRFLTDVDFRNECGRNAKRRYEESYAPQAVRRRWVDFLIPSNVMSTSIREAIQDT
jgi:glycosyltransferase involved in cell wall biosynthesis